ncbi:MAG: glycosyltransferase family 2 protein [Candidatus Paceibacterota bacterium]|jgi:cellulose synthase/poly-beta-1,6-N-acetylglucosamine synthase-like glycosyltransferase
MSDEKYYLKIGTANDLEDRNERILYRLFEMLPGFLSLSVLAAAIFLSWKLPLAVAFFIIAYDIYWFIRSIYFSTHLSFGYRRMRAYEETDWLRELKENNFTKGEEMKESSWEDIYHLIIMPMYKEPLEVVRPAFLALKKSDYPKNKIIVVLSCEESARKVSAETVRKIEEEFKNCFLKFVVTWHPQGLPGEMSGHGSNDAWACHAAQKEAIDSLGLAYEKVVVSSFDVDTCVYPRYFSCLAYHYLTVEKPTRTSFQPIPLYINNIWQAPIVSRVFAFSSTFWHTMSQERPEKLITFSSHSMSFKSLAEVGFKQVNVVSDDSRIFWQCFLQFDGDYRTVPLYYPVSMDANAAGSFWQTMKNIYRQQERWAYGACEIPYFLFGFIKNKKIPLAKKLNLSWELIEGHVSWATSAILIFLLGWLPIHLGGNEFRHTMFSYSLPVVTSWILTFSMMGLWVSVYFSMIMLPPRPIDLGKNKYLILALEWFLLPFVMIFFTSLPALNAQIRLMLGKYMGFWVTPKSRKPS